MAENEQFPTPILHRMPLSTPLRPPYCHRRLDSPRFGASHDSTTAVVGPQLKIAHAPCPAAAMAHACTHAWYARMHAARTHGTHATKREIIPRAACGPFVVRPYRRGGTDTRDEKGTPRGTRARLTRHASETAARGLSPAYLPTCIVACA